MARTVNLGVLDSIRVASPCSADWNAMIGDDRVRFCAERRMNVYNLSALTREQAEALVFEREGRLCARFFRRPDGTVLTRDCPVGARSLQVRFAAAAMRIAAAIAVLIGSLAAMALGPARAARLRQAEPFATISQWIRPAGPPLTSMPMGKLCITGSVAAPPLPAPAPTRKAGNPGTPR